MKNTSEIVDIVKLQVHKGLKKIKSSERDLQEFALVYREAYGRNICCAEVVDQTFYEWQSLVNNYKNKQLNKPISMYAKLKDNVVLYVPSLGADVIGNVDEVIFEAIKKDFSSGYKDFFDVLPTEKQNEPTKKNKGK